MQSVSVWKLRGAIEAILSDHAYKHKAVLVSRQVKGENGLQTAADAIANLLNSRKGM